MRFVIILLFTLCSLSSFSQEHLKGLKKLGEAELSWLIFDVYLAKMWGEKKSATLDQRIVLKLIYQMDFSGKDIAKQSAKELSNIGIDDNRVKKWLPMMEKIFPNVKKGDSIRADYDPSTGIRFLHNDKKKLGDIKDQDFAKSFIGIWLSEKTSQPDMRLKLFGLEN